MAAVQTPPEASLATYQDQDNQEKTELDLMALAMAALGFVSPWSREAKTWRPDPGSEEAKDTVITLAEVSLHDSYNDCWVIIYDRVYDITNFFDEHPGGADIMLEYAGQDASTAFRSSGHSRMAAKALDRFQIGELPMHERMYRRPGGIRLSDIPE